MQSARLPVAGPQERPAIPIVAQTRRSFQQRVHKTAPGRDLWRPLLLFCFVLAFRFQNVTGAAQRLQALQVVKVGIVWQLENRRDVIALQAARGAAGAAPVAVTLKNSPARDRPPLSVDSSVPIPRC